MSEPLQLIVAKIADKDIKRRNRWWRANREEAPLLFATALREAYAELKQNPGIGSLYEHRVKGLRRCLLRPTQHWLYYTVGNLPPLLPYVAVLGIQGPREAEPPDLYRAFREI